MKTPTPRPPVLTLVGFPIYPQNPEAEPFPLTPYRDVVSYTPSGARAARHYESTPVYIPPARRSPKPEPPLDHTRLMPAPLLEPSFWVKAFAAVVVMYATAFATFWLWH